MPKRDIHKEELRQAKIMTILSEKRTILSELRTWITMILFPISFLTALLAITKSLNIGSNMLFLTVFIFSIIFIMVIIYFSINNLRKLYELNKKIRGIELP